VKSLKKQVGLWIDNEKAVIFSLADEGAEIKRIRAGLKNDIPFSGGVQKESARDHEDKDLTGRLNDYYGEVLSYIRDAESILIFGPGEAKLELKKRLENRELDGRIVGIETAFKMTDNEIVAKVRQRFLK
jgi:hypothetical protein